MKRSPVVPQAVDWDSPRWTAVLTYRGENGPIEVMHDIEEIEELHDIVDRGPDWNTLIDIRVTLARCIYPGLTLEQSATLRGRGSE